MIKPVTVPLARTGSAAGRSAASVKLNIGHRPIWAHNGVRYLHTMDFENDKDPYNPNKFRGSRTG
jgi:hypothetical protein